MSTTARPTYLPTTHEIRDAFAEEIASLGGTMHDVYDDGERLFLRSVLSRHTEVRPGDRIRGGVAVRATGSEILVHPYTLRQVCTNGAIAAHALETRCIERAPASDVYAPTYEGTVVLATLREAVQSCASPEAFATVTSEMRSAIEREADLAITLGSALGRISAGMGAHWLPQIFSRFAADGDQSAFGLMNAVTAVAREARDPDVRWGLEELGGSVPARLSPRPKVAPAASAPVGV
jgi:hypothetical protein